MLWWTVIIIALREPGKNKISSSHYYEQSSPLQLPLVCSQCGQPLNDSEFTVSMQSKLLTTFGVNLLVLSNHILMSTADGSCINSMDNFASSHTLRKQVILRQVVNRCVHTAPQPRAKEDFSPRLRTLQFKTAQCDRANLGQPTS